MIIKDPVTCESLVRDNYPRMLATIILTRGLI